jgi:hypothetical protein
VVFPKNVLHKNYNPGEVESLHLSINTGREEKE